MNHLNPYEIREIINERIMSIDAQTPSVHSVLDKTIVKNSRSTPIRIYFPSEQPNLPMILMIHGGTWIAGNLDTHDHMARYLCSKVQAIVVSVGYLNAPEGKFPLPLEQSYDVLLWMREHGTGDPKKIAIVGDNTGANMAAALCLLLKDRKDPQVLLQVLINPSLDLRLGQEMMHQEMMQWYVSQYADPEDRLHPYASPILAKDLKDLAAALIILAEKDDLYESGSQYAQKLREAKVLVNVYTQFGIGHLAGDCARASLEAQESLDVAVSALCGAFRRK